MSDADTSQKVESKKLELVQAMTQLVAPLDQILVLQRSTARRYNISSILVTLVVLAMGYGEYNDYQQDRAMTARLEALAGRLEKLEEKLSTSPEDVKRAVVKLAEKVDARPTIDIEPAPSGDPSAAPMLVIRTPAPLPKPGPNGHKKPPPPAMTVEIPLDLPPRRKKR